MMATFLLVGLLQIDYIPIVAGDRLAWDHDGKGTTHFEIKIDDRAWVSVGLAREWAIPTSLPLGQHEMIVRACYRTACSESTPILYTDMTLRAPVTPQRLRKKVSL